MKYLAMDKQPHCRLICDTNIWYDIAQNGNSIKNRKYQIAATYINIDELSITPNLLTDFELVQKSIIAIFKNYNNAINKRELEENKRKECEAGYKSNCH